jgi:hypothetical protein
MEEHFSPLIFFFQVRKIEMMLVSGIGGLICISLFYALPALLLVIGGLMGIFRKDKGQQVSA